MNQLTIPHAGAIVPGQMEAAYDFTEAWLHNRRFSENTREGYRRDIRHWLTWCAEHGLDPLQVTFLEVNAWAREMEEPPVDEEGKRRRPLAAATIARKLSAVSSWYTFIVKLGRLTANPAAVADRPPVDRDFSPTVSFTREDAAAMLEAAAEGDPYLGDAAGPVAAWMVQMGTRATETVEVRLGDLGHHEGFRTVRLILKGGRRQTRPLPPPLTELLNHYLVRRAARQGCEVEQLTGTLFVDRHGAAINRFELYRFVRRLAKKAGVPDADRISPHSFRHAWNSITRGRGALLEDRQDAMGHRDPRTTRRYDRAGRSLLHDPALLVAAAVARHEEQG